MPTLPYWNYGRPQGAKLTPYLCKDCVVISAALTVRYSLYVKDCGIHLLPICHPCPLFSTPPFIYPSIHLSIHQFISPLFHMWIHLSWPRCCLRSYIDISAKRPQFSNWLKYTILYGGTGAGEISEYGGAFFFFSWETLILSITPTWTEWKAIYPPDWALFSSLWWKPRQITSLGLFQVLFARHHREDWDNAGIPFHLSHPFFLLCPVFFSFCLTFKQPEIGLCQRYKHIESGFQSSC